MATRKPKPFAAPAAPTWARVGSDRCFNDNVPVDLAVKRLGP